MKILQSNISTSYSRPISYERPFNTGNKIVDVIMRNHNWNGAIGMPLEIKYTYANRKNLDKYLTYKDSFFSRMDCTYSAPYYLLAQLSDPVLQTLSKNFGHQYAHNEKNYETNRNLKTDFLYFAEDTHFSTMQGSFQSSKQQCEYNKQLLQENFKRLAYCHPEVITTEGLNPLDFIKDINSIIPMKHKKFTEIYAKTGNLIIEDPAQSFFSIMPNKHGIEYSLFRASLNSETVNIMDIELTKLFNMLSDIVNIKMTKTDNITEAKILFHLKSTPSGAQAYRDLNFFNQHKTDIVFLEGYLSQKVLSNPESLGLKEAWHMISHAFIDHPRDNNMYDDLNAQEKSVIRCGTVLDGCDLNPITLMPYDIMSLQHMYTANIHTRVEDTVYKITATQTYFDGDQPYLPFSIPEKSIYTLYDAGGKNTLDTSFINDIEVILDLNEGTGHLNEVGNNKFLLAFGTNIHKIELGGLKPQVTLHSTIGCKIIVHNGVYDAKIINFHVGQDEIFFKNDVVNIIKDYGFTACDPLGAVLAYVYYA